MTLYQAKRTFAVVIAGLGEIRIHPGDLFFYAGMIHVEACGNDKNCWHLFVMDSHGRVGWSHDDDITLHGKIH